MTETQPDSSKITPLFVFQFCVVLVVISVIAFRPGEWSSSRWIGLCIAVPSAVFLFTARWQLGRSFSVTPQARALVTEGIYSKIRNPIYVFSGLMILGVLIAIHYRYAFLLLAVLVPVQIIRAHQEAKVLEAKFGDEYRRYRERTWF
ncbi:MAG TPA: isoprenylcysteine carboxylmethyltransferase family protein [Terriglobales bacterium]|nr:isoprenylcysteine carboxylmethyltransferase family protein [Terriglobales bacterium]